MTETSYFQFYGTFETIISYLPEEEQLKFYKAFVRYGLYGEEPDFDGKDMAIFCQVKFAIDNQKTKSCVNAENGRKGGKSKQIEANESKSKQIEANESKSKQIEANESESKQIEANESESKQIEANESESKQIEANESKIDEKKRNEMNGNETKRNEHEFENSQEAESARESSDDHAPVDSPPDSMPKDFARQVFDTCARIGMPNCNNNFVNFLQRDFKLALCGIRELKLHSGEVLGALENYGEVLKLKRAGRTWWERDLRLDQLCSGRKKLIQNFLPDNFKIADYAKEKPDKGGGLPEERIRL